MSDNWPEVYGKGRTNSGPKLSGVPSKKPLWRIALKNGLASFFPVVFDDIIYIGDCEYNLSAIDANTGKFVWQQSPDLVHNYYLPYVYDRFLVLMPHIIDRFSGDVVVDLRQNETFSGALLNYAPFGQCGRYIYKQVDSDDHKHEYVFFDIVTGECNRVSLPYSNGIACLQNGYVLGFGNIHLACIDASTFKTEWTFELDTATSEIKEFCCHGGSMYFSIKTMLYKINVITGALIWKRDLADYHEEIRRDNGISGLSVCDDMCYVELSRHLMALSSETGEQIWVSKELTRAFGFVIAGDLLFGVDSRYLTAFDRYTGEEVWRIHNIKFYYTHVVVVKGKLLVFSKSSKLYCYQWDENNLYHSPAKHHSIS